jgi:hypothetical protein
MLSTNTLRGLRQQRLQEHILVHGHAEPGPGGARVAWVWYLAWRIALRCLASVRA